MKLYSCLLLVMGLLLAGCNNNNDNEEFLNVQGTWRGPIAVTSCSPSDICTQAGLIQGTSVNAVLTITQDRGDLDGTFTYEGAPITATVSGRVGSNTVEMNGLASNALGTVTVNLAGNVSSNVMTTTVTHQITLIDGRAANVTGTGTLTRQ